MNVVCPHCPGVYISWPGRHFCTMRVGFLHFSAPGVDETPSLLDAVRHTCINGLCVHSCVLRRCHPNVNSGDFQTSSFISAKCTECLHTSQHFFVGTLILATSTGNYPQFAAGLKVGGTNAHLIPPLDDRRVAACGEMEFLAS